MEDSVASGPFERSIWVRFVVAWAFLCAVCTLWAIATPISAAPDEPAHLVKAASVVRGQFVGETTGFGEIVQVPNSIARSHARTCFAFHPERPADCEFEPGDPDELVDARTTAGLYNPLYYLLVGWPSLILGDDAGIYAMRFASALLTSGLLALSFMVVGSWPRRVIPMLGLLGAVTPMVLFLGGVVNPSGPEVAGTLAVVVGIVSISTGRNVEQLRAHCIVIAVGAVVALNMRGISPMWLAVGILLPLVLLGWTRMRSLLATTPVRVAAIVTAVAAAAAVAWTVGSNSLGTGMADDKADAIFPGVGTHPFAGFVEMVLRTFDFARGVVGEFGWNDTSAPAFSYFLWSALVGGLVAFGLAALRGRRLLVLVGFVGAGVLLPALVQAVYVAEGGYIWQGRYTMPAFAALVIVAAALLDDAVGERFEAWSARRLFAIVAAAWAFAQLDAFIHVLRRYAAGWPSHWSELVRAPAWAPPGGTLASPLIFAATVAALALWIWWNTRPATDQHRGSAPPTAAGPTEEAGSSHHASR
ncbi:hypothetical protein J2X63_000330 [Agromyces sp. 3263]|uniref:DUF2142 domain-containing protein n=1 Tax=Agromyces sp. 3263 TaxID=2817750 RepID=UPI00285A3B30|nr:DUF2142 domain-containing protein [Agromyces sp. 3263]MDR6904644.1 hypothetical protein [Agromyces sp. 3263]